MELLSRYSNRSDLLNPLLDVLKRIRENDQTDVPGIKVEPLPVVGWRLQDRLTTAQVMEIIDAYRSGLTRREVAERFNLPKRTVQWIMHKHGVRKLKPPG